MTFQLPSASAAAPDLDRACVAGGYDNMPAPTQVVRDPGAIRLVRDVDESGYLVVPWDVNGVGRFMGSSATLIERPDPYSLGVELARGKLNQLRGQVADWRAVGLQVPAELDEQIRAASLRFGRAATAPPSPAADADALAALELAYKAANDLVRVYTDQMFQARHQRQPKLDTLLGVRLNGPVPPAAADPVAAAFNGVSLPMTWKAVEPTESQYKWEAVDAQLAWAAGKNLRITAGPLVDFSHAGLPDWLWLWEGDLPSLSSFMCDYVETAVGRYHRHVRRWHLTAASNVTSVLKLTEDDLLWLTARLAEAAWQIDPELELVIGVAQPWGEYMARAEHTYSPFVFADTLIRAGLKLAALDIEWVMGVTPRGSYCRDLLDASRVLDLYALLGTPLQVSLAYPSSKGPDALADSHLSVGAGHWQGGFAPEAQADWAAEFTALAACKPFVRSAYWCHLSDAEAHQFPHCGLLDAAAKPKPALDRLRDLRDEHLR
ncbi:MAG TPA: endo-1,4-beta-xylanase [Gemmataceae bacterium]